MRAPYPTRRPAPRVLVTAVAGLLALLAGPALAADDLVLNKAGELQDPAAPMPAGHPAVHPPMAQAPAPTPGGRAMTVTTTTPAPPSGVDMATAMPEQTADETGNAMSGADYRYQARNLRDPFTLPAEVRAPASASEDVPPLERHALQDFRLVAVVKGKRGSYAMVTTTDGKGYTLRVGTRIGTDGGRVRKISKDSVVVEVVRPDDFGELKKSETILALRPEEVVP
jgi:Tfp pilus assembly protein PilP